jgi:quercetin dioxygenase-like cupin family protein
MKHINSFEVPLEAVNVDGAVGAQIRWLVGPADGAKNFALRMFEIAVDGHTPYHTHDFEHEVFVVSGAGKLNTADGPKPLNPNDAVFVPPNEPHNFVNIGDTPFMFLCIVPIEQKKDETPKPETKNPFKKGKANNC